MKKKLVIIISAVIIVLGVIAYATYHDSSFVKKNFIKYTGIEQFEVKNKYFDNHQSYIETEISAADKKKIMNRFTFEDNLLKLKGKVSCPYISEDSNHTYFVIEDGYGPYGYIVFSLTRDKNNLNVYEFYGN